MLLQVIFSIKLNKQVQLKYSEDLKTAHSITICSVQNLFVLKDAELQNCLVLTQNCFPVPMNDAIITSTYKKYMEVQATLFINTPHKKAVTYFKRTVI